MDETTTMLVIIVGSLIGIILFALIFKWIFGIEGQRKIIVGQTKILMEIAEQQGVSKAKLDGIIKEMNGD